MSIYNITYVSVCCKPTSNLCNLFCDEFPYFMQFVCCSFVVPTTNSPLSLFSRFILALPPVLFLEISNANFWLRSNSCNVCDHPHPHPHTERERETETHSQTQAQKLIKVHAKRMNQIEFLSTEFVSIYEKFTIDIMHWTVNTHTHTHARIYELIKFDEISQSFSMNCQII